MPAYKLTEDFIVSKIDELPTLPTVIYELSRIINDPMSSTNDIEKIMENDISITTKVLKLANSAYYAIPGGVTSLSRAIAYLGFDTVNQLILSSSIISALEFEGDTEFDMNDFWKHCIGVGIAAEVIAKEVNHPMPSDLFTSGLVHDMGKIALFSMQPDSLLEVKENALDKNLSYIDSEKDLDIFTHTKVGGMLAKKWQLPPVMLACIEYHHNKIPNARGGISADLSQSVDIVFLANILIHALQFGNSGHNKRAGAPKDLMERLTIDPTEGFKSLLLKIKNSLGQADEFIRVIGGSQ